MVKVERSFPAPESLAIEAKKKNGCYNKEDVVERLKKDFHDKCYICEIKGLQDPEVEHLRPHKNGKYLDRKFEWDNLFWSCGHCNKVKNSGKYDAGIIDCCKQDPEKMLCFWLNEDDVSVMALDKTDAQAVRTAELIYETFNLRNTGIRMAACEYRIKLLMEAMNTLYRELEKYKNNPNSSRNKRMMHSLLRKESEFASFKRNYVRDHLDKYPDLEVLVIK